MPRPSTAIRKFVLMAGLLTLIFHQGRPASAGALSDHFKQWSMSRQSRARVDKPFSHQNGTMDLSQTSTIQKLRNRLTFGSNQATTSHQMKVEQVKHVNGRLVR